MKSTTQKNGRRTSVEEIFNQLQDEILSLQLRPGDKISEADVAERFGVSRQPVRDAFSRLANLDLLLIRPKRATEVKRFSHREISKSRFVRKAIEQEVLRCAAIQCNEESASHLDAALAEQQAAVADNDLVRFNTLDYQFHQLLCQIAEVDFAFDVILTEKAKVDRLCILGLSREDRMKELIADHRAIAAAVKANDPVRAVKQGRNHFSRLDATIERIASSNANYFEAENGRNPD